MSTLTVSAGLVEQLDGWLAGRGLAVPQEPAATPPNHPTTTSTTTEEDTMTTTTTDTLTWASARSWADLGELTARWILGDEPECPSYGGEPDEETALIAKELAALNRVGTVITYNSQPGMSDQYGFQRASVDLLVPEDIARRMTTTLVRTDLIFSALPPGRRSAYGWLPISIDQTGHVYTSGLGAPSSTEIASWYAEEGVSRRLVTQVRRAWRVSVVDPHWTSNDDLWPALEAIALP